MLNPIEEKLISTIAEKMKERGWRVSDLARATGISAQGLYKIIDGSRWPGPDNLQSICQALGISVFGETHTVRLVADEPFIAEIKDKTENFTDDEKQEFLAAIDGILRMRSFALKKSGKLKGKS